MIDSHCHLAAAQFNDDRDAVIKRARAAGVSPMVTIGDTMTESEANMTIIEQHDDVFATVGVHPHHAKDWQDTHLDQLKKWTEHKKVVGIGEIGLDYHYMHSPKKEQQEVFRTQLTLAKELDLPITVHSREAIEDTWNIISDIKPQKLVLHCCCELFADVKRFLEQGYFLSFTGIATYPKSIEIRETIKHCPLDQLMIETDAPFLAPQKYRGKRNEPAYVVDVAKCVAEMKTLSLEEVEKATTDNTVHFFGLN
jgi:TatD DNase family protein